MKRVPRAGTPKAQGPGRPSLSGGGRSGSLDVPMSPELRGRVAAAAAAEGLRSATWVRRLVERELERLGL